MWLRVVQKDQVGEHLYCAIRNVTSNERILKAAVLKPQDKASILGRSGFYAGNPRNTLAHDFQDTLESIGVLFIQIGRGLSDVVAACRQMFRESRVAALPGRADLKVGNVPVLQKAAKLRYDRKLTKLSETFDRQRTRIIQYALLPLFRSPLLSIGGLVSYRSTAAHGEIKEVPRTTSAAVSACITQNLPSDYRSSITIGYLQQVRRQTAATFPKLHGDSHRPVFTAADQLAEAASSGHGLGHVFRQTLLEKAQRIKEG